MDIPEKPQWLNDYPEIETCLQEFINKLDKQPSKERKSPKIRYVINSNSFPLMWEQSAESDIQWQFIRSLEDEYAVAEIKQDKKRSAYDPEFQNATIYLYCKSEAVIRQWLNRPYEEPFTKQWKIIVKAQESKFPGSIEHLLTRPFQVKGRTLADVVDAFTKLKKYQSEHLTLRQLSARCFWGMSKVLDNQEELVSSLYPQAKIQPRPLIVNLHIPKKAKSCLFIENYDTYMNALQGRIPLTEHYILVYCSGFMASANRIRRQGSFVFHWSSNSDAAIKKHFEDWWLGQPSLNFPVFFWGDLDYSGMAILSALKNIFPEIEAWQPGYERMVEALNHGVAHEAAISGKNKQGDPISTGCDYADEVLLPKIREKMLFVDQEII